MPAAYASSESVKKHNLWRHCAAPQQLCESCRYGKRAQISDLEHISSGGMLASFLVRRVGVSREGLLGRAGRGGGGGGGGQTDGAAEKGVGDGVVVGGGEDAAHEEAEKGDSLATSSRGLLQPITCVDAGALSDSRGRGQLVSGMPSNVT
jgi:hypothetical protein